MEQIAEEKQEEKFNVLLNGQTELEKQLLEFKKACDVYDRHRCKRRRKRYYNLGLMAKLESRTTIEELHTLLKNGVKTFLIDIVTYKIADALKMSALLQQAIVERQAVDFSCRSVTGLAVEITGDCCRLGRFRMDGIVYLDKCNTMTLTIDQSYRYSGFKEIAYVLNLKYYLPHLQLFDEIKLGHEVRGRVVKKLKNCIALEITEGGLVGSYEYLELPNQCYSLKLDTMPDVFSRELQLASKLQADFIVVPRIRCFPFLKTLRGSLRKNHGFKLIGSIDLEYVCNKMLDIMGIMKQLDILWLPNLFRLSSSMYTYITQDVIPIAKGLNKPIIGSVPLERCSDFHALKNHEFLWKIDCIFMEKSKWCKKYPLIVKKLLPIKDFRMAVVENTIALRKILTSYQSVVNFIIRTISTIECQAIFLHTRCETAAAALGRTEIYCPVYVIMPLNDTDVEEEEEMKCLINLAKVLNLRRNLCPIVYTKQMNVYGHKPIEFGIEFVRCHGCIDTGDFVISMEVGKEDGEDGVDLGVGEDVVIMRAFYVAPQKVGEKMRCQ